MNRLSQEKSPYLLQHANNPVDWRAWNEESFAAAREQDKPIFLSIGYSTCHWCHVMERESFESEVVAEVLNRDFIAIKVDREERPDVDRIYMLFVQATTGSGGWPMSVFLTPDLKPFYGGTYFPPENRWGRPGFRTILEQLGKVWREDRPRILNSTDGILEQLKQQTSVAKEASPVDTKRTAEGMYFSFRRSFDAQLGGFGSAPKFPRPATLNFLLRHYYLTKTADSLEMVTKTLSEMALGGMNDQLGGGFHRYSVDAQWFVPHFEKMLYDQAQLASAYLEAYQITRSESFATTAREIFEYVLRDLCHPEGGFFSAEDADSVIDAADPHEKGEGAFYIWTWDELESIVGAERMPWFAKRFGVEKTGNVQEDPHQEFTGRNILYLSNEATEPLDEDLRARLLAARNKRVRPGLDDKVLTAWNGLMISAFALGARVLNEPRYRIAAERAIAFIEKHLLAGSGVLLRRFREGDAAIPGFLDDYAFFAQALLDTYESNGNEAHLNLAQRLAEDMIDIFEDRSAGGFFSTAESDQNLVLRIKDDYDGAEPSGNSVAAMLLWRLGQITQDARFTDSATRTIQLFAARPSMPLIVCALMALDTPPKQVILVGDDIAELEHTLNQNFLPFHIRLYRKHSADAPGAYVCEDFTCKLPVRNGPELQALLS